MDDIVFLATVRTKEALTKKQLAAVVEHGWVAIPYPAEGAPTSLLIRQVQGEDEAADQYADLMRDERLSDLVGIVSAPYLINPVQALAWLTNYLQALANPAGAAYLLASPQQVSANLRDLLNASPTPEKPGGSSRPDGVRGKPEKTAEEPPREAPPKSETFPTIPEYLWNSLEPESQDELVKKLVEYVVNRPNTAAYGSSFDDAALFAHLDSGERPGMAMKILEQKHGMTSEQVMREGLVNNFQAERINLMKQAVATATEMNKHLEKWRDLSENVWPLLKASSIVAGVFVGVSLVFVFLGRISGWEMAVLAFVFALMAVSPATLLLIGRPLKGLDEWSPSKQEKKAEETAKEEAVVGKTKSKQKAGT